MLLIEGGNALSGCVELSGYKHSSVLLVNAALLCSGVSRIGNLPRIRDIEVLLELAELLGCEVTWRGSTVDIDARGFLATGSLDSRTAGIHGSLYLIPVLLARNECVRIFEPGGCRIGDRPVSHLISVLLAMGARRIECGDEIWLEAPDGLRGATHDLREVSPKEHSGRTKAALLAAARAAGETHVLSPFQAREIEDLCRFLALCGADITWNQDGIHISGREDLEGCTYYLPADFLEFATLSCAVQSAGGSIQVHPSPPTRYFAHEFRLLKSCGIRIERKDESTTQVVSGRSQPVDFVCPPIYSDLQPIVTAVLWKADGVSVVRDEVWPERFDHLTGLQSLGVTLERESNTIRVFGPSALEGSALRGNDLRSVAAQLVAALGANGMSELRGVEHLSRGYDGLPGKLCALGASIRGVT